MKSKVKIKLKPKKKVKIILKTPAQKALDKSKNDYKYHYGAKLV